MTKAITVRIRCEAVRRIPDSKAGANAEVPAHRIERGAFIEKELGVPATTRNWSTVMKIVDQLRKSAIDNRQSKIT